MSSKNEISGTHMQEFLSLSDFTLKVQQFFHSIYREIIKSTWRTTELVLLTNKIMSSMQMCKSTQEIKHIKKKSLGDVTFA